MKQQTNVEVITSTLLERVKQEYVDLLKSTSFSLEKLFAPERFRFDEFCKNFSPHPQSDELKAIVQIFGEKHGIWQANAKHHISCALFLYPMGNFERMLTMMKNLTLGFYLNDVMGRDIFKYLPLEQQEASRKMINGMSNLNDTLYIPSEAHPLELVNAEILREFRDNSPEVWFSHFLKIYCYHIGTTHSDGNANAIGYIPGIFDYMERRCHYAGVHHIMLWIEYCEGKFLDWDLLNAAGIAQKLGRLHWVTAAFEALSNALFSFEKEVIDNNSDSNLVIVIALNNPRVSLKEAIYNACEIVRNLLMELLSLIETIKGEIEAKISFDPALLLRIHSHLNGIARCVKAGWLWHCHSNRYKRPVSLWIETRLVSETIEASS
jgi:hypothetical protein